MTVGGRIKSPGSPAAWGKKGWTMTSPQRKSLYPENLEHWGHSDLRLPPNNLLNMAHPIPGVSSTRVASALVNSSGMRPARFKIPAVSITGVSLAINILGLCGSEVELRKGSLVRVCQRGNHKSFAYILEDSGGISKEGRLLVEILRAGFSCDDKLRFLLPGCDTEVLVEPPVRGSSSRTITSSSESYSI